MDHGKVLRLQSRASLSSLSAGGVDLSEDSTRITFLGRRRVFVRRKVLRRAGE